MRLRWTNPLAFQLQERLAHDVALGAEAFHQLVLDQALPRVHDAKHDVFLEAAHHFPDVLGRSALARGCSGGFLVRLHLPPGGNLPTMAIRLSIILSGSKSHTRNPLMSEDSKGLKKGLTSYGDSGFSLFLRKAFIKGAGYTDDALDRPIVGIANTGSSYNPCHGNAPQLIEAVKRGVMLAGGLPMDFPSISIHESFASPTSMYLRNLMSIDTEEMIRAQPMDAVVLIGGCDKTVPAQLMGAASAGMPAVQLVTGSMLTGSHEGTRVGACTDCRRYWGKHRADEIDADEIATREQPARSERGHLLGHGHGEHHGVRGRGAGHDACPAAHRRPP